jgi:hypothetical protein
VGVVALWGVGMLLCRRRLDGRDVVIVWERRCTATAATGNDAGNDARGFPGCYDHRNTYNTISCYL